MTMSLFRHTLTRRRDASASLVQLIVSSREQSSVTRPAEPSKVADAKPPLTASLVWRLETESR